MVSIVVVFYLLIVLFGVIGAMRGWAKEMLVSFSVILALFIITLVDKYAGFIPRLIRPETIPVTNPADLEALKYAFWIRVLIIAVLAYFGYQTEMLKRFLKTERLIRQNLQDLLLGLFIGLLNGFMIGGSVLYYLEQASYQISTLITPPTGEAAEAMKRLLVFLPPNWLGEPGIYFAVGIAFVFVLVVFI